MMEEIKFKNLARVLTEYATEVRNAYQDGLITGDHLATGRLLNTVDFFLDINGNSYQVFLKLEDYWKFVEEGVNGTERNVGSPYSFKSDFVNVGAILNWIRVKPVLPRPRNGKLPTPEGLAWAIARSMAKKGIEPSGDLEEALTQMNAKYEALIMEAIDQDLAFAIDAEIQLLCKPA